MAKQESHSEAGSIASDLIHFLNTSPTAFHAVGNPITTSFLQLLFVSLENPPPLPLCIGNLIKWWTFAVVCLFR